MLGGLNSAWTLWTLSIKIQAVLLFRGKFFCMGRNCCGFPYSATVFSLMQSKNEELSIILRLFWGWYRLWTVLYQNTLVYILVNNFCVVASIPFQCPQKLFQVLPGTFIQVHLIATPWFSGLTIKLHLLWYLLKSQGKDSFGGVERRNREKSFCFGKQRATRDHWLLRKIFIRGVQMQDLGAFTKCSKIK